jgi:hypothetical protein
LVVVVWVDIDTHRHVSEGIADECEAGFVFTDGRLALAFEA